MITKIKYLGIFEFNTILATFLSFESIRIIDNYALLCIKKECNRYYLCQYNKNFFYFYDFLIHGLPLAIISYNINFLNLSLSTYYLTAFVSLYCHLFWGFIASNGSYRLEHIYIPSSDYILNKQSWLQLWIVAAIGHFSLAIFITIYRTLLMPPIKSL